MAAKLATKPRPKKKLNKDEVVYVKTTLDEKRQISALADLYFKGNTSALMRYCTFNFDFKKNKPPIM